MKLQLKRSNVIASGAAKIPTAAQLEYGELAINYNQQDPAIFLKDSNNNVIRIGGIGNIADDGQVELPTTTNPPTSPTPLNGNLWYNSQDGRLYVYYVDANSSQWVDASPDSWQSTVVPDITDPAYQSGTLDDRYINISGDTLTGALLLDNAATVATPDLAFDGDLNTGIYSPGADSLAITTAGTQRVVVNSIGSVGIGTATPAGNLEISATNPNLRLTSSLASAASSSISFGPAGEGAIYYSGTSNHFLGFSTNSTEKLRIDSSGNVGIGNTGPAQKLHVGGKIRFGANTTYYAEIEHDEGTTGANIYNSQDTGGHIFKNSGSEKMQIDGSGNVGIGTSDPTGDGWSAANNLVISSTSNNGITIKSGSSAFGQVVFNDSAGGLRGSIAYDHANEQMSFATNGTGNRLVINSAGGAIFSNDATVNSLALGRGGNNEGTNTAFGLTALASNTTGLQNTAIGQYALGANTTGTYNTAVGCMALQDVTTGYRNTAVGRASLISATTGFQNIAVGFNALSSLTSGNSNTGCGYQALTNLTTGVANTVLGNDSAFSSTTGTYNTTIGYQAAYTGSTASYNVSIGYQAGYYNTTGTNNVSVGWRAGFNGTTGVGNVCAGLEAMRQCSTGSYNVAMGDAALYSCTSGGGNIGFGFRNNLGTFTPVYNPSSADHRICMGHTSITNAYVHVAWTVTSDERDKMNFAPVPYGLDFVNQLKPVAYQFKIDRDSEIPNGDVRFGFKAQDILALEGDNPVIIDTEKPEHLKYKGEHLVPVLVNAVQELTTIVKELQTEIETLKG